MEVVSCDGNGLLLFVGELDFRGVEVGVEFTPDDEAGSGGGVSYEVDDG